MTGEFPTRGRPGARPGLAGALRGALRAGLLLGLAAAVALLWLGGLVHYAETAADDAGAGSAARHTDAIVVLTGGSERLATGLRLLGANRADALFVSGVHEDVTLDQLLAAAGPLVGRSLPDDRLACCVALGYDAGDTAGNARETAAWMEDHGYRSLRLVTSNYHMPRSLLEFRAALPQAEIVPEPVESEAVHLDDWWRWPGSATLIATEYSKYLVARLRVSLEALADT